MQVVKKLGLVKTDKEDRPMEEIKINKAYLPGQSNLLEN
jgi:peptidyl-prolyl cis-trans isomerase-like 1